MQMVLVFLSPRDSGDREPGGVKGEFIFASEGNLSVALARLTSPTQVCQVRDAQCAPDCDSVSSLVPTGQAGSIPHFPQKFLSPVRERLHKVLVFVGPQAG